MMVGRRANKYHLSNNVSLLVASFVVVVAVLVAATTSTAPYFFSEAFVCCRTIKHRIIAHQYYGYEYDRSSIHALPFKEFEKEGKQNHTVAVMTTGIMPVISTKQKNNIISTSVVVAKIISALAITTMTLLLSSSPMVASASTIMTTNENDYVNNNNINNNDPVTSTTVMISAGAGEKISSPLPNNVDSPAVIVRLDSGVTYRDLREGEGRGEGEVVTEGKRVNIQWVLKRSNGYSIDSSSNNDGVPFIFVVGGGGGGGNNNKNGGQKQPQQQRAIAGLDEGIRGMKLGGIRRIVIPPSLAYTDGLNDDGTSPGPIPTGFGPKQRIRRVMENRLDVPDESFLLDVKLTRIQ
jgi:FKBP-type peptidyl-prolyl cis-trans isomerase